MCAIRSVQHRIMTISKETDTEFDRLPDRLLQDDADVATFLNACVDQLKRDKEAYDNGSFEQVSDCALHMPRPGGHLDKRYRVAHTLAKMLFPDLGDHDEPKVKTWGLILYSQLVSKLSAVVRARRREEELARLIPKKLFRDSCLMRNKNAPISDTVLNPVPMPVVEAPLVELQPIIDALAGGGPIFHDADMIEYVRGVMFSDGRLDLCKQVVGPSHIEKVLKAMEGNNHVTHFLLGNNITGKAGAEAVANYIIGGYHPKIETWYLAGNEIDEDGAAILSEALKKDECATSLWLKRNPIGPNAAKALGTMLTVNSTLRTLDLLNTKLLDEGVANLFALLKENRGLRGLYVDANGLTKASAGPIADYFSTLTREKRKGLTRLWAGMNRLGDEGATTVLQALKDYPFIKTLSLNSNRLTFKAAEEVYNAFKTHKRIRVLDVGMYKATLDMGEYPNTVSDEGASFLAKLLTENESLEVLHLYENEISNTGLGRLAAAMQGNQTLISLGYAQAGVRYDKEIMDTISRAIQRNLTQRGIQGSGPELKRLTKQLIHGKRVDYIDSIYRNRAMKS